MRDILAEIIAQMLGGSQVKVWMNGGTPGIITQIYPNGSAFLPGTHHAYIWVTVENLSGGKMVPFDEITTRLKIREESDNDEC